MFTEIGVDVGKATYTLAYPRGAVPKTWPVKKIDVADPDWWHAALELIAPTAIVVAEPTGWHYLMPLATLLRTWRPRAQLWIIPHQDANKFRHVALSTHKTDAMDARALALIAQMVRQGSPPPHCRPFNHDLEEVTTTLRHYVNQHARLTKQTTRHANQLRHFAYALWPALEQSFDTWLGFVDHGAVTPQEIRAYVADLPEANHTRQAIPHLKRLADKLPPELEAPPAAALAVRHTRDIQRQLDQELLHIQASIRALLEHPCFAETTRRWLTVPGSSPERCAALHVATHGQAADLDPDQFKAALAAHPRLDESGQRERAHANRKGYRPAINALHLWAMYLVGDRAPDNPVRRYHARRDNFPAAKNKLARLLSGVARDPAGYTWRPQEVPQGRPPEAPDSGSPAGDHPAN